MKVGLITESHSCSSDGFMAMTDSILLKHTFSSTLLSSTYTFLRSNINA